MPWAGVRPQEARPLTFLRPFQLNTAPASLPITPQLPPLELRSTFACGPTTSEALEGRAVHGEEMRCIAVPIERSATEGGVIISLLLMESGASTTCQEPEREEFNVPRGHHHGCKEARAELRNDSGRP